MKKKKFNPELLKEELKKFKFLNEYSFYTGENDVKTSDDNLILGNNVDEADDEAPKDLEPVAAADDVASELGVDAPSDDANAGGDDSEISGEIGDETEVAPEPEATPAPAPAPAGDEVEVDVTSLVKGSEEAKDAANVASQNTAQLLAKFNELQGRVAAMDKITQKIDTLEKEIVKRNPTPVEKLEMQSLNSFPYSLKLTDYWKEKEGPYDVTNQGENKKEYVLTKDDVNNGYSDASVKQSFTVNPNENNFEEEDI